MMPKRFIWGMWWTCAVVSAAVLGPVEARAQTGQRGYRRGLVHVNDVVVFDTGYGNVTTPGVYDFPQLLTPPQQAIVPWVIDMGAKIALTHQQTLNEIQMVLGCGTTTQGTADDKRDVSVTVGARQSILLSDPGHTGQTLLGTINLVFDAVLFPPPGENGSPSNLSLYLTGGLVPTTNPQSLAPTLALVSLSNNGGSPFYFTLGDLFIAATGAFSYNSSTGGWEIHADINIPVQVTEGQPYDFTAELGGTLVNQTNGLLGQLDAFHTAEFTLTMDDPNVALTLIPEPASGAVMIGLVSAIMARRRRKKLC